MKRWNAEITFSFIKRSAVSVFVLAVILVLPVLGIWQWTKGLDLLNSNKASALPVFVPRPADKSSLPNVFDEPLITITFDDGWETTYSVAAPLLLKNGIQSTQYITTGLLGNPAYLSLDQVKVLHKNHQQIACHTVTHPDLTTVSDQNLDVELDGCIDYFKSNGLGEVKDFAAPYGHVDQRVVDHIKKFYRSGRNTNGDLKNGVNEADVNFPSTINQYDIIGVTVHNDTTVTELKAAVDYTIAHKGWLVLTYHQAEEEGTKFSLASDSLAKQLQYLSSTPVRIVTMGQVMDGLAARYQ